MEAPMARMSKEQFGQECARRRTEGLILSGNTYTIKEAIKASGGIWDGRQKAWLMPSQEALDTMRAKMGGPAPRTRRKGCPACGRGHSFSPCGYPGCNSSYCDECDGGGRYCHG